MSHVAGMPFRADFRQLPVTPRAHVKACSNHTLGLSRFQI
jgi:hypothetical protein